MNEMRSNKKLIKKVVSLCEKNKILMEFLYDDKLIEKMYSLTLLETYSGDTRLPSQYSGRNQRILLLEYKRKLEESIKQNKLKIKKIVGGKEILKWIG